MIFSIARNYNESTTRTQRFLWAVGSKYEAKKIFDPSLFLWSTFSQSLFVVWKKLLGGAWFSVAGWTLLIYLRTIRALVRAWVVRARTRRHFKNWQKKCDPLKFGENFLTVRHLLTKIGQINHEGLGFFQKLELGNRKAQTSAQTSSKAFIWWKLHRFFKKFGICQKVISVLQRDILRSEWSEASPLYPSTAGDSNQTNNGATKGVFINEVDKAVSCFTFYVTKETRSTFWVFSGAFFEDLIMSVVHKCFFGRKGVYFKYEAERCK